MPRFNKKRRISEIFQSKVSLVVMSLLVVFFSKQAWDIYQKERESHMNASLAQAELALLSTREVALKDRVERLKTPEGIEEELRGKYTITKDGEELYVIIDEKKGPEVASQNEKSGWWARFVHFFKREE